MTSEARLLVVDDEAIVRQALSGWLREDGFTVTAVASGFAAVEETRARPYDLVLLDVRMPGMNGIDTLRAILQLHAPPRVIMITADAHHADLIAAMRLGAVDYVIKPFDPERISALVRRHLREPPASSG